MSKNIKWDITYKCNLNCAHCVNGKYLNHIDDELQCEDIKKIIKQIKENNFDYVHLLGGEPTARADILEIFSEFEKQGLHFGFNTNGLKLVNEEFRKQIVHNTALKNIIFSLEGPTEEINDTIRGKKVFAITSKNLEEVVSLKKEFGRDDLRVTVNTVVSKVNLDYIVDMIHFCIKKNVDEIVLLQFIPEGNGESNNQSITVDETIELVKKIANEYDYFRDKIDVVPRFTWPLSKKYSEIVLGKAFPDLVSMCGAGNNFFYINNKGEVFPCDRYKKQILEKNKEEDINLLNDDIWDIASKDGYGEIFEKTETDKIYSTFTPCNECEYLQSKCYPCVAYIKNSEKVVVEVCKKMMEEIKNVSAK